LAQAGRARLHPGVTEEPEDGGYLFDGQPTGEDDAETQLFRKAVQIVAESQKASTSYLQRQLRVGYNSAARLIERMEKDGLVGQPGPCRPPRGADRPRRAPYLRPPAPERQGTVGFSAHSKRDR
jgi:DNA segregation ATPase FtsK/SpoIIIE-like protein